MDISQWFCKPGCLLFGWPYKTGNTQTVHYLFHYMYYGDKFTVCLSKTLLLVKRLYITSDPGPVIQADFVYILCQIMSIIHVL